MGEMGRIDRYQWVAGDRELEEFRRGWGGNKYYLQKDPSGIGKRRMPEALELD